MFGLCATAISVNLSSGRPSKHHHQRMRLLCSALPHLQNASSKLRPVETHSEETTCVNVDTKLNSHMRRCYGRNGSAANAYAHFWERLEADFGASRQTFAFHY